MIKYLIGISLALGSFSAQAADLPYRKAPVQQQQVIVTDSWTGFYIGFHGGYGWADFSPSVDIAPFEDPKTKGWVLGGHAGYMWQAGMFVGGLEVDYSVADMKHDQSITVGLENTTIMLPPGTTSFSTKVESLASVRARAGFVLGQTFLLYGTGGLAWARTEAAIAYLPIEGTGFAATAVANNFGWVAGIGGEWKIMSNLMFRAEFLHYDFGGSTYTFTGVGGGMAGIKSDLVVNVARGGLSYKF